MLCSLSFLDRGTVWRILYLKEVECSLYWRKRVTGAGLELLQPSPLAVCSLLAESTLLPPCLPAIEGCYPSFSCEPKCSLPRIAFVRDVVEAAIGKAILGGRGGRERDEVEGRERKEKVRGRRGSQERVFLYCMSYSSLSVPSDITYKFSLPGETVE